MSFDLQREPFKSRAGGSPDNLSDSAVPGNSLTKSLLYLSLADDTMRGCEQIF